MMESQMAVKYTLQPRPKRTKQIAITKYDRRYITDFSWSLRNWILLYDATYAQGVSSESFRLDGIDDCTCQLSVNPKDLKNPLVIEFSHIVRMQQIKMNIDINHDQKYVFCFSHPVPRVIQLSGTVESNQKVKLQDLLVKNDSDHRDKSLHIAINFTITKFPGSYSHSGQKSQTNVIENIKTMFDNKTLCDITFVFGDKKLSAHKTILAARSKVFEGMFLSPMKEKDTNRVEIVDIKAEIFENFLNYLYIGKVNDLKNVVEDMLAVADKYDVCDLKELCENYMLRNLTGKNAVKYLLIADKLSCAALKKKALNVLHYNANAWRQAVVYKSLETLVCLKKMFSNDSSQREKIPFLKITE